MGSTRAGTRATDPYLPYHFDGDDMAGKQANADVVRTGLCLRPSDGPLFGIVARLVQQKGLDVVAEAAGGIVKLGGQIAILGLGDSEVEHVLSRTARRHRDDIGVLVGFNEPMARRIIAGSDFFLMPSRFEPCGLTQMQAQRYGTLPIAHAVGGLIDTIDDNGTGFLFPDLTADGLLDACGRAFEVFADRTRLATMRRAAMACNFSWSGSAATICSVISPSLQGGAAAARGTARGNVTAGGDGPRGCGLGQHADAHRLCRVARTHAWAALAAACDLAVTVQSRVHAGRRRRHRRLGCWFRHQPFLCVAAADRAGGIDARLRHDRPYQHQSRSSAAKRHCDAWSPRCGRTAWG